MASWLRQLHRASAFATSHAPMLVAALSVLAVGAATALVASAPQGRHGIDLPDVAIGTAPSLPVGVIASSAAPGEETLDVHVSLRPRDPAALDQFVAAVSTPGSPYYRQYLRPGEFGARFGATPATVATVTAALRARGLTVGEPSSSGLSVPVTGTISRLSKAFGTAFRQYRLSSGDAGIANVSAPKVPASIAGDVQAIVGLDRLSRATRVTPKPSPAAAQAALTANVAAEPALTANAAADAALTANAAPNASTSPAACTEAVDFAKSVGAYTPAEIAHHYGIDTLYAKTLGAGATIAIFELETFNAADVAAYQACFGTNASVSVRSVNGGPTGPSTGEAALDIETVIGLAPAAKLLVYQAPNDGASAYAQFQKIADDAAAHVVSDSWGLCEAASGVSQLAAAERPLLLQMAAQGQTVVAATGDAGSEGCYAPPTSTDTSLSVWDPASQPEVTAVGGTSVPTIGAPDTSWNDTFGASGGGISTLWRMPAYQRALGIVAESNAVTCGAQAGQLCRQVPDVSALADTAHGSIAYYAGGWRVVGGTNVAAPIWAALVGLIDSTCPAGPVGFMNPALYRLAARAPSPLIDVTTGPDNDLTSSHGGLYQARAGYDLTTGLGRPDAAALSTALCPPVGAAGSGTMTVNPTVTQTNITTTLTFTYTPAAGTGMVDGEIDLTVPGTWTLPTTTPTSSGYTTASAGSTTIVGNTIAVRGITVAADQPVTIVYGDTSGGGIGVQTPSATQVTVFSAASRPSSSGGAAPLNLDPAVRVLAPGSTGPGQATLTRIAGADRIGTSIAASKAGFPNDNSASAVVLARSDTFPDALAGVPFAAHVHGPLLLTTQTGLPDGVIAEIQRVLPIGSAVFVLGGTSALSPSIDLRLTSLGYKPVRIQGANRYETAVKIANALGDPVTVFEADGENFPDALSAGPAAVNTHGAILLTAGTSQSPATADYLATHQRDIRYAVGGPAAKADAQATPLIGADRYATSSLVAKTFFDAPSAVGVASGAAFPDALSGGPVTAASGGPLVLVPAQGELPTSTLDYLTGIATSVLSGWAFGGPVALSTAVADEAARALVLVPPPS